MLERENSEWNQRVWVALNEGLVQLHSKEKGNPSQDENEELLFLESGSLSNDNAWWEVLDITLFQAMFALHVGPRKNNNSGTPKQNSF